MNECASCLLDFGSVAAFDRHRTGLHEFTFKEGLAMGREDGRRCLDEKEIASLLDDDGLPVFARNSSGRWSIRKALASARALNYMSERGMSVASGNSPGSDDDE